MIPATQPQFGWNVITMGQNQFLQITNDVLPRGDYTMLAIHGPNIGLGLIGQGPYGEVGKAQALRPVVPPAGGWTAVLPARWQRIQGLLVVAGRDGSRRSDRVPGIRKHGRLVSPRQYQRSGVPEAEANDAPPVGGERARANQ